MRVVVDTRSYEIRIRKLTKNWDWDWIRI